MRESIRSRLNRWLFNIFPAYRRTGARITHVAADWSEVRLRLPLNWKTRNYLGTLYGGSMYSAVDPVYMLMLIRRLGPDYIVWDKAAKIRFKIPGRGTLYASFVLPQTEVDEIRRILEHRASVDRVYEATLVDSEGTVHALVEKTIHIRRRAGQRGPAD